MTDPVKLASIVKLNPKPCDGHMRFFSKLKVIVDEGRR